MTWSQTGQDTAKPKKKKKKHWMTTKEQEDTDQS